MFNENDLKKIFIALFVSFLIWLVYTTDQNQDRLTTLEQWKYHVDRSVIRLWDMEIKELEDDQGKR